MNINVCSVRTKTDMLSVFLHTLNNPHVVCLTETWLSNAEAEVFKLPQYNVASYFCHTEARGGGVAILVRDDLQFSEKQLCSIGVTEQQFEAVSININFKGVIVNINCLYRSPNANHDYFVKSMDKLLALLSKSKSTKFICDDFNYNIAEVNKKNDRFNKCTIFIWLQ